MPIKDNKWVVKLTEANPALVLPWFPWYWKKNDTIQLRKAATRFVWNNASSVKAKAVLLLKALIWPILATVSIPLILSTKGTRIKKLFGKSLSSQLAEIIKISLLWGLSPDTYYSQRLYWINLDTYAKDILSGYEVALLNMALNSNKDAELVNNKLRFYKFCISNNLQTVPVIAAFENGKTTWENTDEELPKSTLYFKPSEGLAGKGIERWAYKSGTEVWENEGVELKQTSLLDYFAVQSKATPYILQEAATNHTAMHPYSSTGIVTFRVGTILDSNNKAKVFNCHMVMPWKDSFANHGTYGGFNAMMHLKTHSFQCAIKRLPELTLLQEHPVTHAAIEGAKLSIFPELEELALRAHEKIPQVRSIGWDIAYTPKGAEIVEGNTQWGLMPGTMLGETGYIESVLSALPKKLLNS